LLSKVVNQETGECYTKKDEAGFTNKCTGACYIVTVKPGSDGKGKKEYFTTKGRLEGFDAAGSPKIKNYFYFSLFYLILYPFKDFKNFVRIWQDDKWKGSALHYPIY